MSEVVIDEEVKDLAILALRNAFWRDFSALANKYLEAAEGLDIDDLEAQMGDMTSIYGRDDTADGDVSLNIWTQDGEAMFSKTMHKTIIEALKHEPAIEIHLCGAKVFEKLEGEWWCREEESEV